ncbi:MAG TPA: DNA methyltransferase [Chthonomonadaceae bacterium]|nr:DNA methyltransferase [Chthonomonadaceae bacterium]
MPKQRAAATESHLILDTVHQGDCRDILPTLPANSIDLIFADPPYNLQLRHDLWRPNLTHVDAVNEEWDKFRSLEEYDRFTRTWLSACRRVLKDTGTLWVIGSYHNIYRVGCILQDLGYWILNDIIWTKTNPMPNFKGTRFCNAHETLLWVKKSEHQAKYTFNYQSLKAGNEDLQMRSDWHIPICNGEERLRENGEKAHATQKPEALLHRILRACTHRGDIVLDPFFGTGTTGAVAKRMGRRWIGIEREPHYVTLAEARIASLVPPLVPDEMLPPPLDAPKLKIPFVSLLDHGLLPVGSILRLNRTEHFAHVLEDGTIACNGVRGSIHKVAAKCLNKPACNGWEYWYYQHPSTGEYLVLDSLREQFRQLRDTRIGPSFVESNSSADAGEADPVPQERHYETNRGSG